MRFATSMTFATVLVALAFACGGADTTEPNPNNTGNTSGNNGNQPGCEPNCPVEVKTISRALTSFSPGGHEVYIDSVPTGIMVSETEPVMLTATEGRHLVEIRSATGGLVAHIGDTDFTPAMAATQISEIYRNNDGDWFDYNNQGAGNMLFRTIYRIEDVPDNARANLRSFCGGIQVYFRGIGWGPTCMHADGTLSSCVIDDNKDGVPDRLTDNTCSQPALGTYEADPAGVMGECMNFHVWQARDGVIDLSTEDQGKYCRYTPPWGT
jgi:hypothetical protein